ncbi:hypothetical protein DESC_780303 [Desulfosarcina cetonica]|nr:hypothetical protein DESC_780303 [Desulfosarcina cetonica]
MAPIAQHADQHGHDPAPQDEGRRDGQGDGHVAHVGRADGRENHESGREDAHRHQGLKEDQHAQPVGGHRAEQDRGRAVEQEDDNQGPFGAQAVAGPAGDEGHADGQHAGETDQLVGRAAGHVVDINQEEGQHGENAHGGADPQHEQTHGDPEGRQAQQRVEGAEAGDLAGKVAAFAEAGEGQAQHQGQAAEDTKGAAPGNPSQHGLGQKGGGHETHIGGDFMDG